MGNFKLILFYPVFMENHAMFPFVPLITTNIHKTPLSYVQLFNAFHKFPRFSKLDLVL